MMTKLSVKKLLAVGMLMASSLSIAADWAAGTRDWDKLPAIKVTKLGLYLTPQEAFDMKQKDPKGVALFDIRTRAEAMYVGMPGAVDALIPYV